MIKLKSKLLIQFLTTICFALICQASFALSDTIHFDSDGNIIDKIHYEIIVSEREKVLRLKLRTGYNSEANIWRDPIKLRKKRIFQWRIVRSLYTPDSLSMDIKTSLPKTNT